LVELDSESLAGKRVTVNLTIKFIVAISAIILLSYGFLLYQTSSLQNQLVMEQSKQQARVLYKQIILTRQWVSDHQGLFLVKTGEVKENPYLQDGVIKADDGTVFVKRNPAMVTRELSEYAARTGFCWFRITSLKPVNPANVPDDFERRAMLSFEQGVPEIDAVTNGDGGRVHRYIAPLLVQESCLTCHAEHGYQVGDIRGALSISVPLAWADTVIRKNNMTIFRYALFSVIAVAAALVLLFNRLVARRVDRLARAMNNYPDGDYTVTDDRHLVNDEIGRLVTGFVELCARLDLAQKELDKTMQQAFYNEKMASLGQLTAGIAHEINNPLGGLLNCVKTMQEEPKNLELHARYLPLLEKGLRRIEHIMRQLLNFGRKAPLNLSRVDIDEIIRECFELLEYRLKKINLALELKLPDRYCIDVEALRQIIVNTGLNAIQAMPEGGSLTVTTARDGDMLTITVRDTGTGIEPAVMDRIFDPFFTTKEAGHGTGLGLAISYGIIKEHKGTILVESEVGEGTTFTIILPVSSEPRTNTQTNSQTDIRAA
jgi:two-component system, NtrC family, sensor kinase